MTPRWTGNRYFVGLDLGQAADPTALCVLETPYVAPNAPGGQRRPVHDVPHLERYPLGTPYPEIVAKVVELLKTPPILAANHRPPPLLVVDQTGVGRPVVDMLTDALHHRVSCKMVPITITFGTNPTPNAAGGVNVPKRDLVAVLRVLLGMRRLHTAPTLPLAAMLAREMNNFTEKTTQAGNEVYGAWREGQNDDLVLAVALAAWVAEKHLPPVQLEKSARPPIPTVRL